MEQGFNQLCVWHGTIVGEERIQEFEKYFLDEFGVKVKYLTEIETNPDLDEEGEVVPDTGGRNDLFFYLHDDNVGSFAIQRLQMGIRWWEDVVKYNDNSYLYPTEFIEAHPPTW
jgi:hypothetical protein